MSPLTDSVASHYARHALEDAVLAALAAAGKDPDQLVPEDLAPIDEFHIRGRRATHELARRLHLADGMRVLDMGSGLGGAARYLAVTFGCHVTGLDLTAEYCRVASMLTRRLGLESQVCYRHGDALEMPFADASFDVLWTQHATMNIADKDRLCREMWRVLKPGGILASYDVFAGPAGPVHFPVPWARDASISFLATPERMRSILETTGFEVQHWQDVTVAGRDWFRHMADKLNRQGAAPLGIHVLLGADFPEMANNQVRNLEEDRIALVEAVMQRPAHQF